MRQAKPLAKQNVLWRRIKKYRNMYLFLLPAVIVVIVFSYIPMTGLIMAFQHYMPATGFLRSEFVGLENFRSFLTNKDFPYALRNTLSLNGLILLFGFPLPILLAVLLNELRFRKFKKTAQTITYLPHFISWVVIAGMAYKLLEEDYGNVNQFLQFLGFQSIPFLRNPKYFYGLLSFITIWKSLGWNSIIFLAAITSIDVELYEAATADGAGRFAKFLYITLPSLIPLICLMLVFNVASIFSGGGASFDAVYNMGNGFVMERALTLDYHVYLEGIRKNSPSYATAVGMVISILSFVSLLIANKLNSKASGRGVI